MGRQQPQFREEVIHRKRSLIGRFWLALAVVFNAALVIGLLITFLAAPGLVRMINSFARRAPFDIWLILSDSTLLWIGLPCGAILGLLAVLTRGGTIVTRTADRAGRNEPTVDMLRQAALARQERYENRYQDDFYETQRMRQDPYRGDPYRGDSPRQDPYRQDPYRQDPYRQDARRQEPRREPPRRREAPPVRPPVR